MLVASGLSPYGGLYRVLSAPACGNRWGPSMDNLLPMYERKLSLPTESRFPLAGASVSTVWPTSYQECRTPALFSRNCCSMAKAAGFGVAAVLLVRIEALGAGDGTRTRDVQLGKTTVNWKQRTLRFLAPRS